MKSHQVAREMLAKTVVHFDVVCSTTLTQEIHSVERIIAVIRKLPKWHFLSI